MKNFWSNFSKLYLLVNLWFSHRSLYLLVHQNARKINKKIILACLLIAPPIYFLFQLSAPPILVAAADNWCIYIMFIFYSFDSRFYTFGHWTDFVFLCLFHIELGYTTFEFSTYFASKRENKSFGGRCFLFSICHLFLIGLFVQYFFLVQSLFDL